MRVSQMFSHQSFLRNLDLARRQRDEALARISSGRDVRFASDDPEAAGELVRLADEAQQLAMRRRGISQARPWLEQTEHALTEMGTILTRAHTYAVQASSETLQQSQLDALAETVAGLRSDLGALANQRISGKYIFSGTRTDVPPFDAAGTYQGNDREIELPIDEGRVAINISGLELFGEMGDGGPQDLLRQLEEGLRAGDVTAIQNLVGELKDAVSGNATNLARIGVRRSALEDGDTRLQARELRVARRASELADTDMAAAISDAERFETSYQATLAAGSRLFGPTFFDYIG
jgi:flagellar hook-associated protein 3 FlgL